MNDSRALRWFILLLVLAVIALALHGILPTTDGGRAGTQAHPAPAGVVQPAPTGTVDDIGAIAPSDASMLGEAASTPREYLSTLPSRDFAKANAYWIQGRASGDEANLRALPGMPTSIRVQTHSPEAMPSDAAPGTIEIPFDLRLAMPGDGFSHYRGRYRLVLDHGVWKITSASVDALPAPE